MGKRTFLSNSLSLVINRLTQSITTFILFAFIARLLGTYQLGQYTLAFSYYFFFMTLASQGFKTLFTRELSRNPQATPVYLTSGTLLQLVFSLIAYALLALVIFLLPYRSDTAVVCYIIGLTVIPFSLSNITEAIFQAQEKMHLIAISTVPVYLLRVAIAIWAMNLNFGINFVSEVMVLSEVVILIVEWCFLVQIIKPQWRIDWDFVRETCHAARVFLAIEGIAVFKDRMQTFILSLLAGEEIVGLYGAVMQLMQPFEIISYSLVTSAFPKMTQAIAQGREKQRQLAENLVEILLCVALPFIIGLFFIGGDLLVFLYGDESFAAATIALQIIAVELIATCFIRPLSYSLVANGLERINLREVVVSTTIGAFASVALIAQYQLIGAVLSLFLMQILAWVQYQWAVGKYLYTVKLEQIFPRPLLLSAVMLAVFLGLRSLKITFLPTAIAATVIYSFCVSFIAIFALGKANTLMAKLSRKSKS